MIIYLHRANTIERLATAKAYGYGVEVDIRTHDGIPFLSHDPIKTGNEVLLFEEFISFAENNSIPVILDLKETGILDLLLPHCKTQELYYATDLIFPDQLVQKQKKLFRTLSRWSKYENIARADGYWFDYFFKTEELNEIEDIISDGVLVSPELHKREIPIDFVKEVLKKNPLGVCTDFPTMWK